MMEKLIACCGLNCADCDKLHVCDIVSQSHKFAPEALENLKALNGSERLKGLGIGSPLTGL